MTVHGEEMITLGTPPRSDRLPSSRWGNARLSATEPTPVSAAVRALGTPPTPALLSLRSPIQTKAATVATPPLSGETVAYEAKTGVATGSNIRRGVAIPNVCITAPAMTRVMPTIPPP